MRFPSLLAKYGLDCNLPSPSPCCSCDELCRIPSKCTCLIPEIINEYKNLLRRNSKTQPKKRIRELAQPVRPRKKHKKPCFCIQAAHPKVDPLQKEIPVRTRTEQLSFPRPHYLADMQKHPSFNKFSLERKSQSNRLLRKSLLSVYSHLAKTELPFEKKPSKKFSAEEWKKYLQHLKVLSKPNPERHPEVLPTSPTKRLVSLKRFAKLSKPRIYPETTKNEWKLTDKMSTYKPSKRILAISEPKYLAQYIPDETFKVKPKALKYKATERIETLAQPAAHIYTRDDGLKKYPFKVSPGALKAKTTERMTKLATPNEHYESNVRANPFAVSRYALRAKVTPRLLELSKPKIYKK